MGKAPPGLIWGTDENFPCGFGHPETIPKSSISWGERCFCLVVQGLGLVGFCLDAERENSEISIYFF